MEFWGEFKQSGGQEYFRKGDTHLKEGHTKPCGNLLSQNPIKKHNLRSNGPQCDVEEKWVLRFKGLIGWRWGEGRSNG